MSYLRVLQERLRLRIAVQQFLMEAESLGVDRMRAAGLLQMENAIADSRCEPLLGEPGSAAVIELARVRLEELCWNG